MRGRQWSVSIWEQGEAQIHTNKHTHISTYFGSVLTVCAAAWWAWFDVELLTITVAISRQSVLVNQKTTRRDNSNRKTKRTVLGFFCSGNIIQTKWQATGDYRSRIIKTKWQKAFHISLALNNKLLFCRISLNFSHASVFIWLLTGLFLGRQAVK